jgi:hypothetical protein
MYVTNRDGSRVCHTPIGAIIGAPTAHLVPVAHSQFTLHLYPHSFQPSAKEVYPLKMSTPLQLRTDAWRLKFCEALRQI